METTFRIPRSLAECRNLAEYRDFILRLSQAQVAARVNRKQAWISEIERGHLPRPKFWPYVLQAYEHNGVELPESEFLRLFEGGRKPLGGGSNGV